MAEKIKTAKNRLKKAKDTYTKAKKNMAASIKHGSEKQIKLCQTRFENAKKRLETAREKYKAAKQANPNLAKKTMDFIKNTSVKKACSWTGLAIAVVVTAAVGVVVYDYVNGENSLDATDIV